jgi:hypothetical protein
MGWLARAFSERPQRPENTAISPNEVELIAKGDAIFFQNWVQSNGPRRAVEGEALTSDFPHDSEGRHPQ